MFKLKSSLFLFVCFSLFVPELSYGAFDSPSPTELTVVGISTIGSDLDNVYQNAISNGLLKAYQQLRPNASQNLSENQNNNESKKDLTIIQKELGIVKYDVLRYWREQDKFYVEIKVFFGTGNGDQPRTSRLPKLDWVYQTEDQINVVSIGSSFLAVQTPRTIEVLDPDTGKRKQWIKMGLEPHSIYGERYLIRDGDYLKLCNFKKFNAYNLLSYNIVYTWRRKIPNLMKFYLSDQAAYVIERSGLINAYNLDNGKPKWQLQGNSQAVLTQISFKYLLVALSNNEFWMVNENGDKLWIKRFTKELAAKPFSGNNELLFLFKDGQLLSINLDTGQEMNSFYINIKGTPQRVNLTVSNQKIIIFYNVSSEGHLQVYQKYTGSLIWENNWEQAISDSIVVFPDQIIVGVKNSLEARDPIWGLKLWEEKMTGNVKQLEWSYDRFLIVINEKVFGYRL